MKYLIVLALCVLAAGKVGLQSNYSKKYLIGIRDVTLFNAFIFLTAALLFLPYVVGTSMQTVLFSVGFAVFTVVFQLKYTKALSLGNVSLTVMLVNLSMLFPVLLSAVVFEESFSLLRGVGVLLTVVSFFLGVDFQSKDAVNKKWLMHPAARLVAVKEMDFVLTYDGNGNWHQLTVYNDDGTVYDNLGLFMQGGDIDGNGKASCLLLENAHHYTVSNMTLHNGKKYGLRVGGVLGGRLYELVANNIYCKCNLSGLKGNIGICADQCDLHFTDCFVVDYTTGVRDNGGANRYTRCHIWGGTVPPEGKSVKEWSEFYGNNKKKLYSGGNVKDLEKEILSYGVPEMLLNSVAFEINGVCNVIDGCYADTASIGYWVKGADNVITGSGSFNNMLMGLRNTVAIKNESTKLTVNNSRFTNATGTDEIYQGDRNALVWTNNNVEEDEIFSQYFVQKNTEN